MGPKWLADSFGLPTDRLCLLADVVLDEIINKLIEMYLAVVCFRKVTVLVCHAIQHFSKLFHNFLGRLILAQVLFAIFDELCLHLLHQLLVVEELILRRLICGHPLAVRGVSSVCLVFVKEADNISLSLRRVE